MIIVGCASSPPDSAPATSADPINAFGSPKTTAEAPAPPNLESCATSTAEAKPTKVHLVFLFDRSGSMLEGNRWDACKSATKAFFESKDSAGIDASLQYFPMMGLFLPSCDVAKYATPAVAMTTLPSAAFGQSLDKEEPRGASPMGTALRGAYRYADSLRDRDGKIAVVLVSDGEPAGCGEDIAEVTKLVSSQAASTSTYVIGIGDLASLDGLAEAGGTKKAFIVSTADSEKIATDLQAAMSTIRASAVACDYAIPEGSDPAKVNISHDGKTILQSATCSDGEGWRYDDADAPKRILLCEKSCAAIQSSRVDIVFGCDTKTADVK